MTTLRALRALFPAFCIVAAFPTLQTLAAEEEHGSREIANGTLVSIEDQKRLGLVTVSTTKGVCSGTLLNQFWVLTADHCVTSSGSIGGPAERFANMVISAAWTTMTARPTRYVRYFPEPLGLDVALVFLGAGNLGQVKPQSRIRVGQIGFAARLTKYGNGVFAFARFDPITGQPVPSQADGQYRTADFLVFNSSTRTYTLPLNATTNQVGAAGDSGGPDFVFEGGAMSIVGVQSTCIRSGCLLGQSCTASDPWTWATGASSCNSAPLFNVRNRILQTIKESGAEVATIVDYLQDENNVNVNPSIYAAE